MKKITKIAACGLLAALGLTAMTSCGDGNSLAKEVVEKVILTQDGGKVSADFTVPKIVKHDDATYDVSWTSSDTSVLNIVENNESTYTADVKRPFGADDSANTEVRLTASVTANGKTAKSNFKVTVTWIDANTALSTAITNTGIKASYGAKAEVELPTKSNEYKDEITFEYSLGGEYASAKLEETKLTLDPELGQETIVVKVKATSGSTVVEKEVNTKTSLKTVYLSVSEALAQPKDAMIYVQGKIKSVASNGDKYGNFWIEDEAGKEIEIYGLYKGLIEECYNAENVWQSNKATRYDAWEDFEKLAVGDYVYAYGKRATYNTTEEVTNCILMGTVKDCPASTVKEALDTPKGEYVTTYGEIKSIVSDKYGNIYLKDSDGNEIYLYGLYTGKVSECYPDGKWSDANATRYDNMKDKPQVGDVVAVYGPRDEYNGTQQIKNAILLYYISKADRGGNTEPEPADGFTGVVTAIGYKDVKDDKMRCYVLVQNANSQAKFVYIEAPINTTNTVAAAKAAIEAKFVVGKTVTVKGTTNDYNGLSQYVVAWDKLATDVTLGDAGTAPAALDVTAKVGKNDELKALQGVLVKVTGTYNSTNSTLVTDSGSILVYYENGFLATNPLSALKNGGKYTVTGYLNWYNQPQISPLSADAVVIVDESGLGQTPETPSTRPTTPEATVEGTTIVTADLGLANAAQVTFIKFTDGNIYFEKGSGVNQSAYYNSGTAIRLYKGNVMTFTSDKKIVKIEFTTGTYNDAKLEEDNTTVNVGTMDWATLTWTGEANEVVFTVNSSTSDKPRIVKVVVTYAE